jgi:hypothetical protein
MKLLSYNNIGRKYQPKGSHDENYRNELTKGSASPTCKDFWR